MSKTEELYARLAAVERETAIIVRTLNVGGLSETLANVRAECERDEAGAAEAKAAEAAAVAAVTIEEASDDA